MSGRRRRLRDAIAGALDPLTEPGRTTTLNELAEGCVPAVLVALRELGEELVPAEFDMQLFELHRADDAAGIWRLLIDRLLAEKP